MSASGTVQRDRGDGSHREHQGRPRHWHARGRRSGLGGQESGASNARIIFGAVVEEEDRPELQVMVIAAGFVPQSMSQRLDQELSFDLDPPESELMDTRESSDVPEPEYEAVAVGAGSRRGRRRNLCRRNTRSRTQSWGSRRRRSMSSTGIRLTCLGRRRKTRSSRFPSFCGSGKRHSRGACVRLDEARLLGRASCVVLGGACEVRCGGVLQPLVCQMG